MLAPRESPSTCEEYWSYIEYPILASPKLDGIRAVVKEGKAMSRTFKSLPSRQVQDETCDFEDIDFECIEGYPTDFGVFNRTQSYVMSENKIGDMSYHLFDFTHPTLLNAPFSERYEALTELHASMPNRFKLVQQVVIQDYEQLLKYEEHTLAQGYEGLILKNPYGPYKHGRGTMKQALIFKLKRFEDAEGVVVGFEEQFTNTNVQEKDELGYAKRSSSKAGKLAANTLGKFIVSFNELIIKVNPGVFTHLERQNIWNNQSQFEGSMLKFKYFAHGVKEMPRFANALGFRNRKDM